MLAKFKVSRPFIGFIAVMIPLWLISLHSQKVAIDYAYDARESQIEKDIAKRQQRVNQSIDELGLSDPNLRKCIQFVADERVAMVSGVPGGFDSVHRIERLICRNRSISNLSGIENMQKLVFLDVGNNAIDDIATLADSTIQTLKIDRNPIRNLSAVKKLRSLKRITLPDMPDRQCRDVERYLGKIKSNIASIKCIGERSGVSKARPTKTSPKSEETQPARLTDKQEEFIEDYYFNSHLSID